MTDRARIGPNGGLLGDLNMSGVHVVGWRRCHERTAGTKKPDQVRLSWLLVALYMIMANPNVSISMITVQIAASLSVISSGHSGSKIDFLIYGPH